MSTNTEHIAEGQTELSAATTSNLNLNRVKAALASESIDPETEGDFNDVVEEHYGVDEENEFVAPSGAKASIGGKIVIGSDDDDDDLCAFDPENFIAKATTIVANMPVREPDTIRVRKPTPTEYVRTTKDKNYRMPEVWLLDWKKGMQTVQYLIRGDCKDEVLMAVGSKIVHCYTVALAINNQGDYFLWAVRQPGDIDNAWLDSALTLQSTAMDEWLRVESGTSEYKGIRPQGKLPEPRWPNTPLRNLLKLAFGKSRIINGVDHPAVKAVLGIVS